MNNPARFTADETENIIKNYFEIPGPVKLERLLRGVTKFNVPAIGITLSATGRHALLHILNALVFLNSYDPTKQIEIGHIEVDFSGIMTHDRIAQVYILVHGDREQERIDVNRVLETMTFGDDKD